MKNEENSSQLTKGKRRKRLKKKYICKILKKIVKKNKILDLKK